MDYGRNGRDLCQRTAQHHSSSREDVHDRVNVERAIQECKDERPGVMSVVGASNLQQE